MRVRRKKQFEDAEEIVESLIIEGYKRKDIIYYQYPDEDYEESSIKSPHIFIFVLCEHGIIEDGMLYIKDSKGKFIFKSGGWFMDRNRFINRNNFCHMCSLRGDATSIMLELSSDSKIGQFIAMKIHT